LIGWRSEHSVNDSLTGKLSTKEPVNNSVQSLMKIIFLLLIYIVSFCAIAWPIESEIKINRMFISDHKQGIRFSSGTIYFGQSSLMVLYKDKKFSLLALEKSEQLSGKEISGVELWNTYSDKGSVLAVKIRDWYSSGSNYGDTHTVLLFQLTMILEDKDVYRKPKIFKLGEVELGSSGKGFDDVGAYILNNLNSNSKNYQLNVLERHCDFMLSGEKCIRHAHKLDLYNHSLISIR
jgi:hypothetical protein